MLVTGSIEDIQSAVRLWKRQKLRVGFVPTMGALHEGHLELIRTARQISDRVVVSIFVNPSQFGPNEDFNDYPRNRDADLNLCRKQRVAALFTPDEATIYPTGNLFHISLTELADTMCGASRPGFFEGIVQVINKLFNIVEPDVALFGQKDFQQFIILKRMVQEFNHQTEMVMVPVQREHDGLAYSSRNSYLNREERAVAPALYKSLSIIAAAIHNGENSPEVVIESQRNDLEEKGFKIDYLGVFSRARLRPVTRVSAGDQYVIAGAVYLGKTRLIDNILLDL